MLKNKKNKIKEIKFIFKIKGNIMQKIIKKEFVNQLKEWQNSNVYFISLRNQDGLLEKLKKEINSWGEFEIDYIALIKERWILKANLEVEEFSTFIELNNSRLDLKGKYYYEPLRNLVINESEHYIICYMQIKN